MQWSYNSQINIVSGEGLINSLKNIQLKGNILIISAPIFIKNKIIDDMIEILPECNIDIYAENLANPDIELLDEIKEKYKDNKFDYIIALGGGSVIDTAKILSVILLEPDKSILSRIFRDGLKRSFTCHIPVIATPTTSGTGAEFTKFSTIWDNNYHRKYSLESTFLLPEYVILEPSLTINLSWEQTLYSGLDALSHSTESLWNKNCDPISKAYAKESIYIISQSFYKVLNEPTNIAEREKMQIASSLAGIAINHTKTAIAHSISYPLSSHFKVPHGLASSFTIPAIYKFIEEKVILEKDIEESIQKSVVIIKQLSVIRQLKKYVSRDEILSLAGEMNYPSRLDNLLLPVSPSDLLNILDNAIS